VGGGGLELVDERGQEGVEFLAFFVRQKKVELVNP
jgi:hypothetical protein